MRAKVKQWHDKRFVRDARKTEIACLECGRAMWLPKSKIGMYRRCGPTCQEISRRKERETRRRECVTCGATFYPRATQLRTGHGTFCSKRCNTAIRAVLNRPEVMARAIARGREVAGTIKRRRGPDHPFWVGGPEASAKRAAEKRAQAVADGSSARRLREYRRQNPDKVREFAQRRESRKIGRLARGTVQKIGKAQRWHCAICRSSIKKGYHVDHIRPLARGGEHASSNIQLLCQTCNVRKAAKDPIEYMQSLGRLL